MKKKKNLGGKPRISLWTDLFAVTANAAAGLSVCLIYGENLQATKNAMSKDQEKHMAFAKKYVAGHKNGKKHH